MFKKSCLMTFIILMLLLLPASISLGGQQGRQVILLVVDGLSPQEWKYAADQYPHIGDFWERSSVALMNTGTGGRLNSENAYVTIGAGARALGTAGAGLSFNRQENFNLFTAGTMYLRYNGTEPDGEVVNLDINNLIRVNQPKNYRVVPGTLGNIIREAGLKGAVLGNGDHKEFNRLAVNLAMDEKGVVDYGNVSREVLKSQGDVPFGFSTDPEDMYETLLEYKEKSQLVVIEWGDTFRLRESLQLMSQEKGQQEFDRILSDLDCFMGKIFPLIDENTALLMVTPNPEGILAPSGSQLSLLGMVFGDNSLSGLLTSNSTRRLGLVTNLDIAPTVLGYFEIPVPDYLSGRVITVSTVSTNCRLSDMMALNTSIQAVHQQRSPLIRFYILLQIITVFGAVILLIFKRNLTVWRPLMAAMMLIPLSFLLFPLIMTDSLAASYVILFVLTILLTALFLYRADNTILFLRIGLVITLSLVLDLALGGNLIKNSIMGYDPISGARYYGIGNEYMGVLVGSSLLFISSAYQLGWDKKRFAPGLTLFFFVFILYVFLAPRWGANFGGSLTALAAFVFTYLGLGDYRLAGKTLMLVVGAAAIFIMSLVLLNLKGQDGFVSHVGQAMVLVSREGISEVLDILTRKGAMNLKLLRYSLWSRVLLVFLGLMAFLFYQPPGMLKKLKTKYNRLSIGFAGIMVGSITAILVNDSGVVAGATTLLYAGMPLLLLAVESNTRREEV
ncbi:hypothetical protein [Candidatus Contubernalis alkaliaceticus]|uniref:hypothetical protein n=1 Tax=Candidatus Contubernalis alkaliaceticus TaxID=338645 RepID=UPI001F4C4B0D|nr:hypothetical protein [Candidatus Contubernalis alkalaceticus]UNC91471.1 hypothetical protein HUE98_04840 [Candidatus Contubernalis alkalaceticus]